MFDLHGDNMIHKSELVTMLHNTIVETMPDEEDIINLNAKHGIDSRIFSQSSIPTTRDSRSRRGSGRHKRSDSTDRVAEMAEMAYRLYDVEKDGALTYEEFKEWLQNNPKVMEVFSGSFHEEIWSTSLPSERVEVSKRKKKAGNWCGLGRKIINKVI